MKTRTDFNYNKTIGDKQLTVKLTNASIGEHCLCLKLIEHIEKAVIWYEKKELVNNFIDDSMAKLKNGGRK